MKLFYIHFHEFYMCGFIFHVILIIYDSYYNLFSRYLLYKFMEFYLII